MNIKEAKQEIKNTLKAYLEKDENGNYLYPRIHQRPILIMGAPGIGKTAIMEQIADECSVGLVAYTITHHTRQSAIGLPHIRERVYDGKTFSITEYTMSEIIDSVYACMEKTGRKEGILFIDEINCASETLSPVMLQFLQNKTFGTHEVPKGWLIVAAGNPPEYNKSVREFDIVTLDRLRRIDVEIDVNAWMEYAIKRQLHGAVISYLTIRPERFYHVENTVDGKFFVTARGWEDLSALLLSYERLNIPAEFSQIVQFLQYEDTAREFAAYYRLYLSYGEDYHIPEIIDGSASSEIRNRSIEMATQGGFEERFTVVSLVLDYLNQRVSAFTQHNQMIRELYKNLELLKKETSEKNAQEQLDDFAARLRQSRKVREEAGLIGEEQSKREAKTVLWFEKEILAVKEAHITDRAAGFERLKKSFEKEVLKERQEQSGMDAMLDHAFSFIEDAFGDDQEMVLFMTRLSANENMMSYISSHGCKKFFEHSDSLLYKQQEEKLRVECEKLTE